MGENFGCVVLYSSVIIFGPCWYGVLWLGQVECVPFSSVMQNSGTLNYHHWVLHLESLKLWYHRELVFVLGYTVLIPVLFVPMIMLFISLVKLWIIFLSVVETLAIVACG